MFKIINLHLPDFLDFNLELHQFSLQHQYMLVEEISEMAAEEAIADTQEVYALRSSGQTIVLFKLSFERYWVF